MGRIARKAKRKISRRTFLKQAGLGAVAAPLLASCSDDGNSLLNVGFVFKHGVASGDPLPTRVILWTHVSGQTAETIVDYTVATDRALTQVVKTGTATTSAARDYTVKVDADGLLPATTYYYQFSLDGGKSKSAVGRTRTAPLGATQRLRVGVASCASLAHGHFNAYRRIAERADLDLVLHLGDYIYEYGSGQYGDLREYEPAHEILTLADYRLRHSQYKRDVDLQAMHRQHPVVAVWDDHETADNSYNTGANNHTEGEEGTWVQRKAWALQAYHEWMPIRTPDATNLERIYRGFRHGDLADFIMLDTRLIGRDVQAGITGAGDMNDPNRSLLGEAQRTFLAAGLNVAGAQWKILGQQVMFGQLRIPSLPELVELLRTVGIEIPIAELEALLQGIPIVSTGGLVINTDQWDGYRAERTRVFDMIEASGTQNAVVLTGDIHTSWAMNLSRDPFYILNPALYPNLAVEFVCTSVTSPGLGELQPAVPLLQLLNPHMQYVNLERYGYMVLDITPERMVGEHWYVSTITERGGTENFGAAFAVAKDARSLTAVDEPTEPRANPPPLA